MSFHRAGEKKVKSFVVVWIVHIVEDWCDVEIWNPTKVFTSHVDEMPRLSLACLLFADCWNVRMLNIILFIFRDYRRGFTWYLIFLHLQGCRCFATMETWNLFVRFLTDLNALLDGRVSWHRLNVNFINFPSRNFHELIVVHCDTTSHDEERSWIFDVDPNDAHEYFKGSKLSYTTLIISINHYQSFACAEPFSTMMIPNYHIKKNEKDERNFHKTLLALVFSIFSFHDCANIVPSSLLLIAVVK